jgi:signal transduction histidine kinase
MSSVAADRHWSHDEPDDTDSGLWRATNAFRIVGWSYAAVIAVLDRTEYRHPAGVLLILVAMAAWTLFFALSRSRTPRLMVLDLCLPVAFILLTPVVDTPERIQDGAHTVPGLWSAAAVLAWAVWGGRRTGIAAACTVAAADVLEIQGRVTPQTLYNIVLLLLLGVIVGYAVEVLRQGRRELAAAIAVEAATEERERLARDIHDSVLQVLAYVQRRGAEIGGDAAALGRLAGEQEVRLRSLVATGPAPQDPDSEQDLRALLGPLSGVGVTLTGPAGEVPLRGPVARALAQATGAALDNVRRHAGDGARTWILIEDEADTVAVTVRDDGAGIPPGRQAQAEQNGRMGLSLSIRGRIEQVGGTVQVTSASGEGTEVEMRVPRESRR